MEEPDLRPVDTEQASVLCTTEIAGTNTKDAASALDDSDVAGVICSRDEEGSASPLTEHKRTTGERPLDPCAHAYRQFQRCPAVQLRFAQRRRQLDQCERIALRQFDERVERVVG